ncbi:MAG: NAD-dependent epimerase/dehydratase family protein [Methanomassiliicoccaceae archaeon]|nr:NAD-dependent epimerase/dehydratase family protein [Methanomassiliicoccaceae archaeon]
MKGNAKKAVITGGSGFIAGHLADRLISEGWVVTAVDRTDMRSMPFYDHGSFNFVKADVTSGEFTEITKNAEAIFHLAANSDTRSTDPDTDIKDTLLTTRSVLDAMVKNRIKRLFFSSSSAVYGEIPDLSLSEDTGDLRPISYYGASKLASESLIHAYSYMNSLDSLIFRLPNVVGPGLTHGVIYDFIRKLRNDPVKLEILGNGEQRKQYLHVCDLTEGICTLMNGNACGVFNISTESFTTVNDIAKIICNRMSLKDVKFEYTGGQTGWKGDVRTFELNITKIKRAGWTYRYDSTDAVKETVNSIIPANDGHNHPVR